MQTLERIFRQLGYPKTIRIDRGTEFVSRDLDLWAYARGVTLDFSRPGKPTFFEEILEMLASGSIRPRRHHKRALTDWTSSA